MNARQTSQPPPTPDQIRAARGLLNWSLADLSRASGVTTRTLIRLQNRQVEPLPETLAAVQAALEKAGVEFLPPNNGGPGVRMARNRRDK